MTRSDVELTLAQARAQRLQRELEAQIRQEVTRRQNAEAFMRECQAARHRAEANAEHWSYVAEAAEATIQRVRDLIPATDPELIEAGYGVDAGDLLRALDGGPDDPRDEDVIEP